MKKSFLIIFLFSSNSYALTCNWWQIKVKEHIVHEHQQHGSNVGTYTRKEHCREKWKYADLIAPSFKNTKPENWPHQEKFKSWNQKEIELILRSYGTLPEWLTKNKVTFHRGEKSIVTSNQATTDITTNSISIYNNFYRKNQRDKVITHELAHIFYQSLSPGDIMTFSETSGWTITIKNNQIFEIPPQALIKDSKASQEEDFANTMEIYLTSPQKLKAHNLKLYEYFNKRYPK
jgi:hypothetical protein